MKNTQRGFIMPLLLALIAILLVGGGAYVYTQNKQVNPTVTEGSTTQVPTVATDITVTYPNGGETLEVNEKDDLPKGINFVTRWTSNNLSGTTNVYLINATDGSVCLLGSAPVKQGSFGNVLGVSFKCKNTSKLLTSGQYKIKLVADTQSPSSDLGVNDMSDNYFTLNVVSTNQITSTAQTANWNTYLNMQYGFEFKYPATYVAMQAKDGILITSSNVEGGNITFVISPIPNGKTLNINCQPSGSEDVNSIVDGFHSAECKNLENANGVRYTRGINTGMSTEQTYRERILKGYFLDSKESVIIQTTLTDASGNTSPTAASVFDGIMQSIKFITPATLAAENAKNSVISQCGVKLTIKTSQIVSSQDIAPGNNSGGYIMRQFSVESTPKSNLQIECVARSSSPNGVSYNLSVQSDGSSEVNKNNYPVFDQQTMSSITKLYSAKNRGYRNGSETIGFETKDWMYTFSFTNPEQAKNQDTFVISVVNPAAN